ncbi:MAG: hypothetical protein ABJ242_00905 [Marinomonas sp.]
MKPNAACTAILAASCLLAGCTAPDEEIVTAFDGIGADEVVTLSGTEPFWSAAVQGSELTYTTPENLNGTTAQVTRFAGNGGLSFSGNLDGKELHAMVTPGECNDGMSEALYPFTATVQLGEALLTGCAHTDKQPHSDPEASAEAGHEAMEDTES